MSTWERLAALPLVVESHELETLEITTSRWTRLTTVVHLRGADAEGLGEDITYEALDHVAFKDAGAALDLAGEWTLDSFSEHVGGLDLFPGSPPQSEVSRHYRRWAVESAALDLALRQAGRPLPALLDLTPRPVTYVVSLGLGYPASTEPLEQLLRLYPGARFKLDPDDSWDDRICGRLAELGVVDTVDMKGLYEGEWVRATHDPEDYRRVAEAFPDAWIEDPRLTPEIEAVLEPHRGRITWDAALHSVADLDGLPFQPRTINIKPSRFGAVRELCEVYDWCAARDVGAYAGGQFELGVGRGQIQYLASLFHADGPNDAAPSQFNHEPIPGGLPASPLEPAPAPTGFRWEA